MMTDHEFLFAVIVGGAVVLAIVIYILWLLFMDGRLNEPAHAAPRHAVNVWDDGSWSRARQLPRHVAEAFDQPPRRLCAHADQDGKGMHWLAAGETCPRLWEGHLAPHIYTALLNAAPDETCIDTRLTDDAWDNGPADDPWEGFGDAEGWVKALYAGKVTVPA